MMAYNPASIVGQGLPIIRYYKLELCTNFDWFLLRIYREIDVLMMSRTMNNILHFFSYKTNRFHVACRAGVIWRVSAQYFLIENYVRHH